MEPAVSDPAVTPKFRMKWGVLLVIVFVHVGAVFAPFAFSWPAFWVFLALQWITGALGITLGYHRLLTHRSFQCPKWLEYALTVCGALALQGSSIKWVATHRVHHAYTDRPQDPHSPNRGFWWAHAFWLFAYDDVLDHPAKHLRYVPELAKDPVHRLLGKTDLVLQALLGVALFVLGGWSCVVWGIFMRLVVVYHCTWLVNSAAHIWGYQTYQTNEGSRNNWWVALLTYGEGWHNNHHAYPYSAAHGQRWWEFDVTYVTVRLLSRLRLATAIRLPRGNPAQLSLLNDRTVPARRRFRLPKLSAVTVKRA